MISRYKSRSTKYYAVNKETGEVERLSLHDKKLKSKELVWNKEEKRVERLRPVLRHISKKERLRRTRK